jgi:hypothetical protein
VPIFCSGPSVTAKRRRPGKGRPGELRQGKRPAKPGGDSTRKDRLIQTRVPRDLEETLKQEAERQRTSVSQLIRNILEDAFQLVDGVVADVDQLVSDSVALARNVRRGARRIGSNARRRMPTQDDLSHVDAWNEVVLNRRVTCSRCGAGLARGGTAWAGLSDAPRRRRAWLCADCAASR